MTALNLAAQTLSAVKERNKLDPALVDDVVLGCVDPVGEAGGDIARSAALTACYGSPKIRRHPVLTVYAFGQTELTLQNEWDDPCLIGATPSRMEAMLRVIAAELRTAP